MKSALLKTTLREIKNTRNRFFSIFSIVALGVGFFSGIKAAPPDMRITADKYFDDTKLMHFRLVSTYGFDENDIDAMRRIEGAEVYPSYFADLLSYSEGVSPEAARVFSMPADHTLINTITITGGRMPEAPDECIVNASDMNGSRLAEGTKVYFTDGDGENPDDMLSRTEYTVVGSYMSSMYVDKTSYGSTSVGNGSIGNVYYIPAENFCVDYNTEVYLRFPELDSLNTYEDEYEKRTEEITEQLEAIADVRSVERYDEIMKEADEELADAKQELADAEAEANQEIADAEKEIADAKQKLEDAGVEIADAEKEIADAEQKIADAEKELADGEKELADGRKEIDDGYKELADARAEYEKEIADAQQKITDAEKEIAENEQKLADGEKVVIIDDYDNIPSLTTSGGSKPSVKVGTMTNLDGHISFVEGRMFEPGMRDDGVYEVITTQNALKISGLTANTVYEVANSFDTQSLNRIKVEIVGIFTVNDPNDTYWSEGMDATYLNTLFMDYDTYFDGPVKDGVCVPSNMSCRYNIDYPSMDMTNLAHINETSAVQKKAAAGQKLRFSFPAEEILIEYEGRASQLRMILWLIQIPVMLMIVFYLFMVSQLNVEQEKNEIAVFKSRGASSKQIFFLTAKTFFRRRNAYVFRI